MDIVIGHARIYALGESKHLGWIIHGGRILYHYEDALTYAHKVNQLIQQGEKK